MVFLIASVTFVGPAFAATYSVVNDKLVGTVEKGDTLYSMADEAYGQIAKGMPGKLFWGKLLYENDRILKRNTHVTTTEGNVHVDLRIGDKVVVPLPVNVAPGIVIAENPNQHFDNFKEQVLQGVQPHKVAQDSSVRVEADVAIADSEVSLRQAFFSALDANEFAEAQQKIDTLKAGGYEIEQEVTALASISDAFALMQKMNEQKQNIVALLDSGVVDAMSLEKIEETLMGLERHAIDVSAERVRLDEVRVQFEYDQQVSGFRSSVSTALSVGDTETAVLLISELRSLGEDVQGEQSKLKDVRAQQAEELRLEQGAIMYEQFNDALASNLFDKARVLLQQRADLQFDIVQDTEKIVAAEQAYDKVVEIETLRIAFYDALEEKNSDAANGLLKQIEMNGINVDTETLKLEALEQGLQREADRVVQWDTFDTQLQDGDLEDARKTLETITTLEGDTTDGYERLGKAIEQEARIVAVIHLHFFVPQHRHQIVLFVVDDTSFRSALFATLISF